MKCLIAGDVKGEYDMLFARVSTVNSNHGPFDALLVCGDFFGAVDPEVALAPFISGERAAPPVKTYILHSPASADATDAAAKEVEISSSLVGLAGAGIISLGAMRIAYLSARGEAAADGAAELRRLAAEPGYAGVDLLLTPEWPRGFFQHLPDGALPVELLPDRDLPEVGSEAIAEVAAHVRPRYHFVATENEPFARAPFFQGAPGTHVCRLVALAAVQADKKRKWIHALSVTPMAEMGQAQLGAVPEGTTTSPYPHAAVLIQQQAAAAAAAAAGGDGGGAGGKRKRVEHAKDERPWVSQSCWFCMASPQFESHFVVSVAEETYVCVAKGPIVQGHALVLPINHRPCSLMMTDAELSELSAYTAGLKACYEAQGNALLTFERYMANGNFEHMHLQHIPLPAHLAAGARGAFEQHGRKLGLGFEVLPPGMPLSSHLTTPEPFFAVTLPSGEQLVHRLKSNPRKHPLQFGREVVAMLLGSPQRADWKNCLPRSGPVQEIEARDAEAFKKQFDAFDPFRDA